MPGAWAFPRNYADVDEGLADAGIETFRDAPYSGIARECGQNSLDAALVNEDGSHEHVVLEFTSREVPTTELPGRDQLQRVISRCLARAMQRNLDREREFFSRALKLLGKPNLTILQIADRGTFGLRGPCRQGTPFHALVKATGVSEKYDASSGGSFGIGKNAAFAVSAHRTVFYSTIYDSDQAASSLVQGKAVLASHHNSANEHFQARGFWGCPESYQPLTSFTEVPDWLRRTERGTTVTAIGFPDDGQWQARVAESLMRNFFAAIYRGKISFDVDRKYTINVSSVASMFAEPDIASAAESLGTRDDLEFSASLLRCFTSESAVHLTKSIDGLGSICLHLLVAEGLPKRVAVLRNGMYITDNLKHFGDKFARFALQKDFVAVIEPADSATSAVFRRLENPRHDELSQERVEDPAEQRRITRAFKELIRWIRDEIRTATTSAPESETLLEELNEFFSTPDRVDGISGLTSGEDAPEVHTITKVPTRTRDPGPHNSGNDGGSGGSRRTGTGGDSTTGPGVGDGRGGQGATGGGAIRIQNLRTRIGRGGNVRHRLVSFESTLSAAARMSIRAAGMSSTEAMRIVAIDGASATGGAAFVSVVAGERKTFDVEFASEYGGPIEVVLVQQAPEPHEAQ